MRYVLLYVVCIFTICLGPGFYYMLNSEVVEKKGIVVDKEIYAIPINKHSAKIGYRLTVELSDPWCQVYRSVDKYTYDKLELNDSIMVKYEE